MCWQPVNQEVQTVLPFISVSRSWPLLFMRFGKCTILIIEVFLESNMLDYNYEYFKHIEELRE